jgi:hypothetical protein
MRSRSGAAIRPDGGRGESALRLPDDVDTFAMMTIGWPVDNFGALTLSP